MTFDEYADEAGIYFIEYCNGLDVPPDEALMIEEAGEMLAECYDENVPTKECALKIATLVGFIKESRQ
jgi:hypothetical protein